MLTSWNYAHAWHQAQNPVGATPWGSDAGLFHIRHQLVENFLQLRTRGELVVNHNGHTVGNEG